MVMGGRSGWDSSHPLCSWCRAGPMLCGPLGLKTSLLHRSPSILHLECSRWWVGRLGKWVAALVPSRPESGGGRRETGGESGEGEENGQRGKGKAGKRGGKRKGREGGGKGEREEERKARRRSEAAAGRGEAGRAGRRAEVGEQLEKSEATEETEKEAEHKDVHWLLPGLPRLLLPPPSPPH